MGRLDLIEELDLLIEDKIEKPMGANIQLVLYTYKNLPALNSITKSNNIDYEYEYVRKIDIKKMLDEVEEWLFQKVTEFEGKIRFRESQKIMW